MVEPSWRHCLGILRSVSGWGPGRARSAGCWHGSDASAHGSASSGSIVPAMCQTPDKHFARTSSSNVCKVLIDKEPEAWVSDRPGRSGWGSPVLPEWLGRSPGSQRGHESWPFRGPAQAQLASGLSSMSITCRTVSLKLQEPWVAGGSTRQHCTRLALSGHAGPQGPTPSNFHTRAPHTCQRATQSTGRIMGQMTSLPAGVLGQH